MHAGVVGVIASRSRLPTVVPNNVFLLSLTGTHNFARTSSIVDTEFQFVGSHNAATTLTIQSFNTLGLGGSPSSASTMAIAAFSPSLNAGNNVISTANIVTYPFVLTGPAPIIPSNSTMLLMHFNGTEGSQTFVDSSSHGLVFTADDSNQTLSSTYGEYGTTGAAFPTNNGISAPYPSYFNLSGPFTFECTWTAPASFPNSGGGYCLVSANNGVGTGVYGNLMLIWLVTPAGKMQWYTGVYGYTDTRIEFSDLVITPGAQNKLAVTRDANGVFRGFVNGKLSTTTATDTRDWTQNTGTPLQIGSIHPFNDGHPIIGIDELRVLNECLFTYSYEVATAEFSDPAVAPPAYVPPPPPPPPPSTGIPPNPLVLQSSRGTLS